MWTLNRYLVLAAASLSSVSGAAQAPPSTVPQPQPPSAVPQPQPQPQPQSQSQSQPQSQPQPQSQSQSQSQSQPQPPRPAPSEATGFQSAGDLFAKCSGSSVHGQSYCYAYLAAVSDSVIAYQVWLSLRDICLPREITQGELKDVFTDFLVRNPTRATDQAASIVVTALQARFRCAVPAEAPAAAQTATEPPAE